MLEAETKLQKKWSSRERRNESRILPLSPPRPPLPSKRLVIRSRRASALKSERRPFFVLTLDIEDRAGPGQGEPMATDRETAALEFRRMIKWVALAGAVMAVV